MIRFRHIYPFISPCLQCDPGKDVSKRIVKGKLLNGHLSAEGALQNAQLRAHHDGLILFIPNVILVNKLSLSLSLSPSPSLLSLKRI